jgi:hypothetical protein
MTDDPPDITNIQTFAFYAIFMILFGVIIGIGFIITFAGLNISLWKGIQIIFVLFGTGFIIAVIVHKIVELIRQGRPMTELFINPLPTTPKDIKKEEDEKEE